MNKLLVFIFLCIGTLQADSIEQLQEALPLIDEQTLVIFDVHNTLVRPAQQLGTHPWGRYVYEQLIKQGMSSADAKQEAIRRTYAVVKVSDMVPVESETASLVRQLQDSGVKVMALTGSPPTFSECIPNQLLAAGIDLSRNPPVKENFELKLDSGAKYEQGILYAGTSDKGEVLKTFLSLAALKPARVVYLDDREQEINRVSAALSDLDIGASCLRYDGATQGENVIEPAVVELQWELMGKILSDAQARDLLEGLQRRTSRDQH